MPLTTSLNFLPAENTGTVFAGILIALPDCGFLPFLAALLRGSKVPKPTRVTFLPFETVYINDETIIYIPNDIKIYIINRT